MLAFVRSAIARFESDKFAPSREAPEKSVLLRSPLDKLALRRMAPDIFASKRPIPCMSESLKSASLRMAQRRSTFFRVDFRNEAEDKSAAPILESVRFTESSRAPVKFV